MPRPRDRTGDLQIFGLTLSQLSYRGADHLSLIDVHYDCFQSNECQLPRQMLEICLARSDMKHEN